MTDSETETLMRLIERKLHEHARAWIEAQPWYQEENRRIIALFEGREPSPPSPEYVEAYGDWTKTDRVSRSRHG